MEKSLQLFVDYIYNKTGINVLFENGNERDFSSGEIITDTVKNRTDFLIKIKGKNYVGEFTGAQEKDRTIAVMIKELAEKFFIKDFELSPKDFYRLLLLGEIEESKIHIYGNKYSLPDVPCEVMLIKAEKDIDDILGVLKEYSEGSSDFTVKIGDNICALVKFSDIVNDDYRSSNEYAEFLVQSVFEETGLKITVYSGGRVPSYYEINKSYKRALDVERTVKLLNPKGSIHFYKDYVLVTMLENISSAKLEEYLGFLRDKSSQEIFDDEEMINTAEEFLENNLNVSETSRKLYLHRNTLTYRLDKIEKCTGLDVRKFSDAMTFRLITILSKILK